MESELEVAIASLHGNPAAPVVSRATNAFSEELEQTGPWAMLVGVDFPEPGCFKVIGRFRGETLEFVVEVLEIDPAPRGSQLLAPFKRDLQQALSAGMSRGPVEAISACRVEAPEIARSLSRDGVRVGRSSHRLRNPANVTPEWVAPIMDAYRADSANREPTTRALGEGRAGYVEPIVVQPLCTTCHGETPADEIAKRLTELYPQDRATGYRVGELRGVFWVEYPTGK